MVLRMSRMLITELFSDATDVTVLKPLKSCSSCMGHNCCFLLQSWAQPLSDGSQLPFSAAVTELKMCPAEKLERVWH